MEPRIIAALVLVATSSTGLLAALTVYLPRRRRQKLRQRGIKTFDH